MTFLEFAGEKPWYLRFVETGWLAAVIRWRI